MDDILLFLSLDHVVNIHIHACNNYKKSLCSEEPVKSTSSGMTNPKDAASLTRPWHTYWLGIHALLFACNFNGSPAWKSGVVTEISGPLSTCSGKVAGWTDYMMSH